MPRGLLVPGAAPHSEPGPVARDAAQRRVWRDGNGSGGDVQSAAAAFDKVWEADCRLWHDRICEADLEAVPPALQEAGALAAYTDSALSMAPFVTRATALGHVPGVGVTGLRHGAVPAHASIAHPGCSELWCDFREFPRCTLTSSHLKEATSVCMSLRHTDTACPSWPYS